MLCGGSLRLVALLDFPVFVWNVWCSSAAFLGQSTSPCRISPSSPSRGGCCSAALNSWRRERCEDNLACPPAGPAGMLPLCCGSSACHQAEVMSWLEISVLLLRDVSNSIPALAEGKVFVKVLCHLPDSVSGWIPRWNGANLGAPQSVTTSPRDLSCSILATACGTAHWQSPSYSSASGLRSHKVKPMHVAFIHVCFMAVLEEGKETTVKEKALFSHWMQESVSCWRTMVPTQMCFLFSSPLPLWQRCYWWVHVLVCSLPLTQSPRYLSPWALDTFAHLS